MAVGDIDIPFFQDSGFVRKKCLVSKLWFWTRDNNRDTCGDTVADEYTFIGEGSVSASNTSGLLDAVNVYPNPYFGRNVEEKNPLDRFVTFTHLGVGKNTIRI